MIVISNIPKYLIVLKWRLMAKKLFYICKIIIWCLAASSFHTYQCRHISLTEINKLKYYRFISISYQRLYSNKLIIDTYWPIYTVTIRTIGERWSDTSTEPCRNTSICMPQVKYITPTCFCTMIYLTTIVTALCPPISHNLGPLLSKHKIHSHRHT